MFRYVAYHKPTGELFLREVNDEHMTRAYFLEQLDRWNASLLGAHWRYWSVEQ